MTVFWGLAIAMLLLALAFVLPPLLRNHANSRIDRDSLNMEVTRERLAELEQDLQDGRLEQAQYQAARQDLERELLGDLDSTGSIEEQRIHSGRWAVLLIAVAIPTGATLLYKSLGSEPIIARLQQQPSVQQTQATTLDSIETLVEQLATRLQNEPDDLRGWVMLAKSYSVMNRHDLALPAYRNIMRLGGGNDAGVLADYADALAATGNGVFTDEAGILLTDALKLEPDNIKALWLAGHWQNQSGDAVAAIAYWEQAASQMPAGSEDSRIINRQIQQVQQQAGMPMTGRQQATAVPPVMASEPAAGGSSLQVTVSLDPTLSGKAKAETTVFIYARAAKGPRMPLAIVRKQVQELPVTVTLDDSMAMAPGMLLSGFQEVTVGARISATGTAMPQTGDLQGLQSPVRPAESGSVDILIDSILP